VCARYSNDMNDSQIGYVCWTNMKDVTHSHVWRAWSHLWDYLRDMAHSRESFIYECVMSHVWTTDNTHMKKSRRTWMTWWQRGKRRFLESGDHPRQASGTLPPSEKFSKVSFIVISYSKSSSELTFENFSQASGTLPPVEKFSKVSCMVISQ